MAEHPPYTDPEVGDVIRPRHYRKNPRVPATRRVIGVMADGRIETESTGAGNNSTISPHRLHRYTLIAAVSPGGRE